MSLYLGIFIALLCAFASNLAFLYKHRGCSTACTVDIRHPLRTAGSLWSQRWFAIGMGVGLVAWLLHVAAISLAPLSVVQAVLSGGLVLLAVMADRLFGFSIGPRQWWGLGMTCVGLVLLAITLPKTHGASSSFSVTAMIAFEAGLFGLGAAAGILFGVCNLGVKALTGVVGDGGALGVILSPWTWVALSASAAAFYASARSLQDGDAVPVIAITGTAANIATIAGGIIVFGDPLPNDALGIVLQALAFVLVIVASALTPAPVRAARVAAGASAPSAA